MNFAKLVSFCDQTRLLHIIPSVCACSIVWRYFFKWQYNCCLCSTL